MYANDVHAIGLGITQGLFLTESFYWDLNDSTRAWTRKVVAQSPNNWPSMSHAGSYAGTWHYLKTVADMGVAEAKMDGVRDREPHESDAVQRPMFRHGQYRRGSVGCWCLRIFRSEEAVRKHERLGLLPQAACDQCPVIRRSGRWPPGSARSLNFKFYLGKSLTKRV